MSFNIKNTPPLQELKENLKKNPKLISYYWSADALIGPSDSINYIHFLWEERQKKVVDNMGSSAGKTV